MRSQLGRLVPRRRANMTRVAQFHNISGFFYAILEKDSSDRLFCLFLQNLWIWILVDIFFLFRRRLWLSSSPMIRSPSSRRPSASSTRTAMVSFLRSLFFSLCFFLLIILHLMRFSALVFRSDCLFCCFCGVLCLI